MRTEDDIKTTIAGLKARQQEVLSFYEDFPAMQRFTDGRDRMTLYKAAEVLTRWQDEIDRLEETIAILRWTLGEIEHLPWR